MPPLNTALDRLLLPLRAISGLVIHPTMLKEEMLKTKEKGAVWDAALYALVDRIISIDPAVWVIQPSK